MTESEFLLDLAGKCIHVQTPENQGNPIGSFVLRKIHLIEQATLDTVSTLTTKNYFVENLGLTDPPEKVHPLFTVRFTPDDADKLKQYLDQGVIDGTWTAYEYESGRSDLGHFFAKVWVANADGTESEKRIRVAYDAAGNPSHAEVV